MAVVYLVFLLVNRAVREFRNISIQLVKNGGSSLQTFKIIFVCDKSSLEISIFFYMTFRT